MTSNMRAPSPAVSVVNSSSDIFSQLLLNNVQSVIADDLEIVGTVGQCTCGSPKCDGGSPIELTHDSGPGALFGSPDAPPMILVENRASVPALMLTEDDVREASVVTSVYGGKNVSAAHDAKSTQVSSNSSDSSLPLHLGFSANDISPADHRSPVNEISARDSMSSTDIDSSSQDSSHEAVRHDRLVQTLSNTQNYYDTKYGAFNPFNTGL